MQAHQSSVDTGDGVWYMYGVEMRVVIVQSKIDSEITIMPQLQK